jgi:hypothetical protein
MDLSPSGLLGAMLGTIVGVLNYVVFLRVLVPRLRALDKSQSREEQEEFERKMSLMRRIILAADVVLFAAVGYYAGRFIGG